MLSKLYILLISSAVFSVHTHAVTVLAPTGPVTGRTSTKGNFAFLGIPFAEAGRWEAPSVVTPWISPLEAFEFKQSCPQICQDVLCPDSIGEDCLFLNVWTPAADSSKIQTTSTPLSNPQTPVLVFFHGGSFDIGGAGMTAYDGAELAAALGVVVVTFNYRLSVFGFFDFAGVDPSDTAPSAVNFGILDQRAALTWVQTNIASFGGNAADVTLLGQSAGAQSILLQLLQPSVRSTIKNIILMSPPALSLRTSQRGRAQAAAVAKKLGCSSRSCLNLHSMRDILTANADASDSDYRTLSGVSLGDMTPIVDGVDITMNPYDVLGRDDLLGGLRIVIGGVSNETWLMIDKANPGNLSTPLFNVIMEAIYTPHDEVLRNVYDADSPGYLASRKPVLTQMTSDWIFLCPQRKVLQATSSTARVWAYILEAPWLGGSDEAIGNICDGNACHTTDLSYLFRTPGDSLSQSVTSSFRSYLSDFMGGRDPLAPSTNMPAWTSVGANAAMLPILRFPAPKASEAVYQPVMESRHPSLTRCRKWDNVGYQYAPVDDAATVAARKRDSAGLTKTVVVVTMALLVTIVIIEACLIVGSLLLRQRLQRIHRAVEFDEAEMSSAVKTLKKNQSMLMKSGAADETQVGLVSKLASAVSKRKQSIYEEERPDPVLVECRSVTYRAGDSVHGKRLLDDVTIACRPGSVTAIMGPSGAGKTTLLSLLTRRLKAGAGVEERILYRRRPLSHITAQKFRAMTGFVAQHDAPYYGLTVREVMMFNAMLELPPTIPNIEKVRRVHRLLRLLNLLPCADVVIQRPEANKGGISGGQMRRLSIAVAMLKRPSVIFLDEPTSGLDAKSSLDVAKAMSELGSQGYTVICSIHQPRPEMFALFDQVTVLVHGRLLFSGPPDESVEHFKKLRTRLEAREAGTDNVIEDAAVHRQGTSVVGSDIVSREDGEGADRANPADLVLDVASTIKPIDSAWAARQWFPLDVIDEEEANTAAKVSEGRPPVQPTAIDVGSVEDMTSRSPQPANGRVSTTRNTDIFNETLEVAKKWTVVEGGRVFVPLQGATRRASEPLLRATSGANGVFILKPDWQDRLEIGTTMRSFAMDANSPSADGERSVIEPSTSTSQSLDLLSYNKDAKAIKKVAPPRPSVALQVLIVTGRWWATRPILRKFNMMIVSACGVLILSLLQRRPGTDVLSLVLQTKGLALACIGLPALKNIHISFDYYDDRDIYNFDSQNGTVAAITFFVHRLVYETANATMEGFIAVISAYFILGCNPDPIRIGTAMILFVVYYNCTTTLFTLVYCTRLARPEARSVAFFSQAVLAIVSGIWIKKGDAAIYDGIAWAQYLNPTYWALSALVRTNAADTGECILRKEGVCQATVGDVIAEEARADRISPRSGLFALGIIWATMRCIQLILLYRDAYWDTFYTGVKQSISDWLKKQMTDPENQATAGTQTGASLEAMPDLYPIGKKGNVDRESGMA